MRRPSPAQASFRRRVLIWAPLALLAAILWLATYQAGNGATVLGFGLLMFAAVGIVADDGQSGRAEA
ncbi:hypothetical protein [Arthrobacter sp.]|uniref:hypothetical protein n=1 Tax=Arthrobacter sp. TaxID=1667 RepID=UPI003A8DCB89